MPNCCIVMFKLFAILLRRNYWTNLAAKLKSTQPNPQENLVISHKSWVIVISKYKKIFAETTGTRVPCDFWIKFQFGLSLVLKESTGSTDFIIILPAKIYRESISDSFAM